MLTQLIYASRAVRPMSEQDLMDLLRQSRDRNRRQRITGMLAYKNLTFLQALEGEAQDIEPVWGDIQTDPRHENIILLRYEPMAERDFPEWSMGFLNASRQDMASIPGYSDFLGPDFSPDGLAAKPGQAREFLLGVKYTE
jgi:hypothetical protein